MGCTGHAWTPRLERTWSFVESTMTMPPFVALLDELAFGRRLRLRIRNTVARAQGTYGELKRAFGDSCVKLVHSRFIATDRMANDAELLRLLGPDSSGRPDKLVVVGTQVIEQSL